MSRIVHGGPANVHAVVGGSHRSLGFVVSKNQEPTAGLDEYRLALHGLFVGWAAKEPEIRAAGKGPGGSEDSDLPKATRIAAALVGALGHIGEDPLIFLARRRQTNQWPCFCRRMPKARKRIVPWSAIFCRCEEGRVASHANRASGVGLKDTCPSRSHYCMHMRSNACNFTRLANWHPYC